MKCWVFYSPGKWNEDTLFTFKITSMDERTYVGSAAVVYLRFYTDGRNTSSNLKSNDFRIYHLFYIIIRSLINNVCL